MSRHLNLHFLSGMGLLLVGGMASLHAQMSAPLVGLISGQGMSRNQILPVVGVLGSSTVREAIPLSGNFLRVHLAPTGGWALVELRGQAPALMTLTGVTAGEAKPIGGLLINPIAVSFSPSGKSAALRFRSGTIQVVTGLNDSPQMAYQTEFSDASGVARIAVSDDGKVVAATTGSGMVYTLGNSAAPLLAYAGSKSTGVAFIPNQPSAVLADGGNGAIALLRMTGGSPDVQTVANLKLSGSDVLLEASGDGSAAFVVSVGDTAAYRIDLASGATLNATLPVPATRLDRLRDGQSFVISVEPGEPAWILTGSGSGLQTVFAANPGAPSPIRRRTLAKEESHRD